MTYATLAGIRKCAAHTFHLTLKWPEGQQFPQKILPGQVLKLNVGAESMPQIRTYTIWNHDKEAGTLELAVSTLSSGPAAKWVKKRVPGEHIGFEGPKGKYLLSGDADNYLLIGDISALAHMYVFRRHLKDSQQVTGWIFTGRQEDIFPDLDGKYHFKAHSSQYYTQEKLADMIEMEVAQYAGKTHIYLAGMGEVVKPLGNRLKEDLAEQPENQVSVFPKSFWLEE